MRRATPWLLLLAFSLFLIMPVRATDPVFEVDWDRTFGGINADFANEVLPTSDGGYISVGVDGVGNDLSYYVIKLDGDGDLNWDRTLSIGLASEYAYDVVEMADGYVIIGKATMLSPGESRPWLIKLDQDGEIVWSTEKTLTQSVGVDSGIIVGAAAGNGKVIVAGGSNTMTNPQEPWILLVDSTGNQIYFRELDPLAAGFGQGTYVLDIVATPDGGFALTGTVTPPGLGEAYLWKFDSNGHEEWVQTYGSEFFRAAQSVRVTTDGQYLLTGCDLPNCNNSAVLKTDADGTVVWYKEFENAEDYSQAQDIVERSDGSLIMLQKRFDASGTTTFSSDLLQLDVNGNLLHSIVIEGGESSTALRRLHLTDDGMGWIAAGNSNETTNGSEVDFYVVKGSFLDMTLESPLTYKVWLPLINQ